MIILRLTSLRNALIITVALFGLTACGGGGSGSGAQAGDSHYTGAEEIFLSAPSIAPESIGGVFGLRITISGSNVTITNANELTFSGSVTDNKISATGTLPLSALGNAGDGTFCEDLKLTYSGVKDGAVITGTSAGKYNCTRAGVTIPITWSGTFRVSAVAKAIQGGGKSLKSALFSKIKEIQW